MPTHRRAILAVASVGAMSMTETGRRQSWADIRFRRFAAQVMQRMGDDAHYRLLPSASPKISSR